MLLRPALLAALLLLAGTGAEAGDAAAGRKKAVACQACHGLDGVSKLPDAPNLSGQVEPYLVKALGEFRDGTRRNEVMSVAACPPSAPVRQSEALHERRMAGSS
ncbi:MAG: c-type cytochrome [Methylobacterium sp.]|uniref:c-type cytochrome n=1 Tax=Methylobacterium sp. TaxID=409 RepID=UPI00258545A8|nr:c-type cytochrome [Methylobacterium sp.]MBY0296429.1 c-type cytochrome [Methylobacterium sp.]